MALKKKTISTGFSRCRRVAVVVFLTVWLAWEAIWTKETLVDRAGRRGAGLCAL